MKNSLDILNNKDTRRELFRRSFMMFYVYNSGNTPTWFQITWCEALEGKEDIMFLAFRGSAKTTIVRWFVVWCICYAIEPYIVVQSYEDSLSKSWVREVAKMLMLPSIVQDYGVLFPLDMKRSDMSKSSMGSFETTNGVKIEAKSLGGTIRGANTLTQDGESTRPTLLVLDDIDVEKSVRNESIIEENEAKIISETMGALDANRRRILFLGNVINEDGVVPRFKKRFKDTWKIFEQWIYDENGDSVWSEVFTEEVIERLKGDGERSFAQNYLGVPFTSGESIIKRSSIRYADNAPSGRVIFGIDPAFSQKTNSDSMALSIVSYTGNQRYVLKMIEFRGRDKDEEEFVGAVEQLYRSLNCVMINIESNNGGEIIARMLQRRNMAVSVKHATKDKITRLREYEGAFERGEIFFLPGTEKGVDQLLSFPNGKFDDMCDSLIYSLMGGSRIFTEGI